MLPVVCAPAVSVLKYCVHFVDVKGVRAHSCVTVNLIEKYSYSPTSNKFTLPQILAHKSLF